MDQTFAFDDPPASLREPDEPALYIDVDGFEGPLDLLLELARRQKVDLHRISILALTEQYIAFVEEARRLRLELAADYLVMAAWLAYLKSRLLLPEPPKGEEPSAADLATALAFRLRRLEAIRAAAGRLAGRDRLGRDVFARGEPEPVTVRRQAVYEATLYDLLAAYARQRQKQIGACVTLPKRQVWSLAEAREALARLTGQALDWTLLDGFLERFAFDRESRATVRASGFAAALEMVREGTLALRQEAAFGPLYIRRAATAGAA
jgi:segregation and condensation protein A